MVSRVDVYYEGWGEHWLWGSLVTSTAISTHPLIAFEYSDEARKKGFELSAYRLPLAGERLRSGFPAHQLHLPGPVYDSLPDGWGMLLMDRLFRSRGLNPARIGPLERLTYIGNAAMGALSFQPVAPGSAQVLEDIPLEQVAAEVAEVLDGNGGEFVQHLLQMGGSPQGARPKVLIYQDPRSGRMSTVFSPGMEAWLVKFPARHEHPEVCAVETVYADCLRACGIDTPVCQHMALPSGLAAFASKRFDRTGSMRVPMQSLAAFTGADYQQPGSLDYVSFLRATGLCANDVRQKALAFQRAVFNVVFNNRDDHPKNFAYLMSADGEWALAPAYDVTFCEGPGGYHQMDVFGQALDVSRDALLRLGVEETEMSVQGVADTIDSACEVASTFTQRAQDSLPGAITKRTAKTIQARINQNIALLR
jgi:serine/threonine-protein kinase HipA